METPALLRIKSRRTLIEYFWTLSPFTFQAVFDRDPQAERATYLDADLYFFDRFSVILDELDKSGRDALLTEHAYDPRYDQTAEAGRFCVQFITIRRSAGGNEIMTWWQDRCLEWCHNRVEDGKFGDQRYLDQWPVLFGQAVHVLSRKELALAPWNADFFAGQGIRKPVFYHFHGLRIVSESRIRLSTHYRIGSAALRWYRSYAGELGGQMTLLKEKGIPLAFLNPELSSLRLTKKRHLKLIFIKKTEHWAFRLMSGRWTLCV